MDRIELERRMTRPQRHRLLQGFPSVPAMVPTISPQRENARLVGGEVRSFDGSLLRARGLADIDRSERAWLNIDRSRDLIVGVIPHTQCVPRREACGFCTFPHDAANKTSRLRMVEAVIRNIEQVTCHQALAGRDVHSVYLGGGTANLSSPEEIAAVLTALRRNLVLGEAELTLEGTPALFEGWFSSHLTRLSKERVAHRRISMGVQTFDVRLLELMGREKFGDAAMVRRLAKKCRELNITTSADLLYDLPGQTFEQMARDVDLALEAGLDQICLYHLVLYDGLGTPWARDEALLRSVPDNEHAVENWLGLRQRLIDAGYEQSTLTNFERRDARNGPKRFRYEAASFAPDRTDALGFGPLSLTTFIDWPAMRGLKLLRRKHVGQDAWSGNDLEYRYDPNGLRLLMLTRGLATTRIDCESWAKRFGTTVQSDFAEPLNAVIGAGLATLDERALALTPRGMFFADSVVSTFAASLTKKSGAGVHTADLLAERPRSNEFIGMG